MSRHFMTNLKLPDFLLYILLFYGTIHLYRIVCGNDVSKDFLSDIANAIYAVRNLKLFFLFRNSKVPRTMNRYLPSLFDELMSAFLKSSEKETPIEAFIYFIIPR